MKTPLHSYTCLAFLVNRIIDAQPDLDLSFKEIFDSAHDGNLISLVAQRYGHIADFSWLLESGFVNLEQMEATLCNAAAAFAAKGDKPTGPLSGLCLVMDIVLEAIQRQVSSTDVVLR